MLPSNFKEKSEVLALIGKYPLEVQDNLLYLRKLIQEVANENKEIGLVTETLKWGEPSYTSKHGSTLRMDWKPRNSRQYALYFQCTSQLVPTFKLTFGDAFQYEGTRAIILQIDSNVPINEIKKSIKATLLYHQVKKLHNLGIGFS